MNNIMRHYIDIINEHHIQGTKISKDAANYTDHVTGLKACLNCEHFLPPHHCMIVEGFIEPDGWCRYFESK